MSSNVVLASALRAADLTRETFSVGGVDLEVIYTPAMQAAVEIDSRVQTVEVAANGMTADMFSNALIDQYTEAMGADTDGVIGVGMDSTVVLLDRLSPASPRTPLDSASFVPMFAQRTGGNVLAYAERVSVVPPPDRLLALGIVGTRADLFMSDDRPAPAVTWYDGLGIFAWLTQMTGRPWGFPDRVGHQVAGLAGRNPREFPFPTRSGTEETLPGETHYGQPWETGVTVANRSFAPTPWGHRDMAGNLGEWMQKCEDPLSWLWAVSAGSWFSRVHSLRVGTYHRYPPTLRCFIIGLRGRVGP